MSKKLIITIARQYGSGGREIGERIAAALGIPKYDKELITEAASRGDLDPGVIQKADETAANSLLYTLAMGSNVFGTAMSFGYKMPINDKLFLLQSDVIKSYAKEGSCVIIGRCADYVLKKRDDVIDIFIYSDLEHKTKRAISEYGIDPDKAAAEVQKTDKYRANHYNYYTEQTWGDKNNYHLCLNSGFLGVDNTVDIIVDTVKDYIKNKQA